MAAPPTLPLASSANCCFHDSKPAAEVPHWAALADAPIHKVSKTETATALNHPKLCILSSRQHKNETLLCRSRQEGVPNRHQLRLTPLQAIKREHTEYIAATIPSAGLLILPNTSHFAFLQDPGLFDYAVLHFLGDR